MRKFMAIVLGLFGCTTSLPAWNQEGHMVVAQYAYNHLDPSVKTTCDSLIAVTLTYGSTSNNTFVTASCWADDYKSSLGTGIWHYIDLPFSLDGSTTAGVVEESFDIVKAIRQCVTTLQTTTETQVNKATSLRYLLHFVGDIQQPLHCSTAVWSTNLDGDAGGNGFNITGTWSNLHSLWDSGGGFLTDSITRPLNATEQGYINTRVSTAETSYPFSVSLGVPDPMDWAIEGEGLAETVSYVGVTRGTTPSAAYYAKVQATTTQRMAIGGTRLANLLNTILASTPVEITAFKVE
ncbi:MAG: S1/P1 nuclease [Candidatus Sumerlaeaceae bacterium]|nr:S1/P1 nuclease [Candidatus Sumerlaeaceae bacterium]